MGAPQGNRNAAGHHKKKGSIGARESFRRAARSGSLKKYAASRYSNRPDRERQNKVSSSWERSHGKGSTPAGRYGG